jgi:hypothetical protein
MPSGALPRRTDHLWQLTRSTNVPVVVTSRNEGGELGVRASANLDKRIELLMVLFSHAKYN